jgi:hypothetical protein
MQARLLSGHDTDLLWPQLLALLELLAIGLSDQVVDALDAERRQVLRQNPDHVLSRSRNATV